MHRFYVETDQIERTYVRFSDRQAHQLRHVLRVRAGDRVRVFDGKTPLDRVVELTDTLSGDVVGEAEQAAEPKTRLVAYPALLQRDKFEAVLQKLTELGASAIVPLISARGLVQDRPDEKRTLRWRAILREAAEQCGRGTVPELRAALRFDDAQATAPGRRVVAYEGEHRQTLHDALANAPVTVSVFVGPEGGFTPDEIAAARSAGAHVITLGSRVLRAETASPVLTALVLYELGDLA